MLNIKFYISSLRLYLLGRDLIIRKNVKLDYSVYGTDYGAWPLIDHLINKNSIVYSFGIGEDISWDLSIIKQFDLTVHGFDPTPKSVDWVLKQDLPSNFIFHPFGLGEQTGDLQLFAPINSNFVSYSVENKGNDNFVNVPVKSLSDTMIHLNHKRIDVLKMDIEGAEYGVIKTLLDNDIRPQQLLVEFHHRSKSIGKNKTIEALQNLKNIGYVIFYVSNSGQEIGFYLK